MGKGTQDFYVLTDLKVWEHSDQVAEELCSINAVFFTKTFLEGEELAVWPGPTAGKLALSSHLWGGSPGVAPHLLQCPLVETPSIMETSTLCLQGDREEAGVPRKPQDLTKHCPLSLALALLHPQLKNGSQCTSLP